MAGLLSALKKKKKTPPLCSAVVVAAGSARRMEGVDKILAPLGELPVLVHTLMAFQGSPCVKEIVVVTREDLLVEVGRLCRDFALDKVTKVIVGGAERIHSVQAGLRETDPDAALIAIHDGARPLVTGEVIQAAVEAAAQTGAAAPAIEVVDTIKRAADGRAAETVDRSALRAVQTPQVFDRDLLQGALQAARDSGAPVTDDCSAVERLGKQVFLTEGSYENLKITTPIDLVLAEAIWENREAAR